jgi:hypothetical protein
MLTRIVLRNFKRLAEADIELGDTVVFIGPNNSGKTSALQALALWEMGIKTWLARRGVNSPALKRPGVTINRKDLIAVAIPEANLLWKNLQTHRLDTDSAGKTRTKPILIEIIVEGITSGVAWTCGLEFNYANPESLYCRPLRTDQEGKQRMPLPESRLLEDIRIAFLPPMSGLASVEPKLEQGRINVLIGEGQTAQVLRNLCHHVHEKDPASWDSLVSRIHDLFGVELLPPDYDAVRGEVVMSYRERGQVKLDLSSSGRGLQQTLLLLSYLYLHPGNVVLLDEPDAHLEILRQRQNYRLINEVARERGCQIIAASHSEIVLNEAAEKDGVVAFIGRPHTINNKVSQLLKSLTNIGFEHYYLAEERGWVLYLEGPTDLDVLRSFAKTLEHPALTYLEAPFVHYAGNNRPHPIREHFFGLKEAKPNLVGLALFDRMDIPLQSEQGLTEIQWSKREIENYFCREDVLLAFARGAAVDDLFEHSAASTREETMRQCIKELVSALEVTGKPSPWSDDIKATDDFLDPLFANYLKKLGLPPRTLRKNRYHELASLVPKDAIPPEVAEKLDAIMAVARRAVTPAGAGDI